MTPARQAAFLPTARAGGCTPGEPPSCLPQGRGVAPQASRLLAYGKGGGLHPRQAAFLPAARAGGCTPGKPPSCLWQGRKIQDKNAGKTRESEGAVPTARAPASGPKREKKFFAKLSYKKAEKGGARMIPTLVIGLLVAVIFFAIVGKGIYNRKHQKGGCSCGGNCGACGGCGVQVTKSQP